MNYKGQVSFFAFSKLDKYQNTAVTTSNTTNLLYHLSCLHPMKHTTLPSTSAAICRNNAQAVHDGEGLNADETSQS